MTTENKDSLWIPASILGLTDIEVKQVKTNDRDHEMIITVSSTKKTNGRRVS